MKTTHTPPAAAAAAAAAAATESEDDEDHRVLFQAASKTGIAYIAHGNQPVVAKALYHAAENEESWRNWNLYIPPEEEGGKRLALDDPKLNDAEIVVLGFSLIRTVVDGCAMLDTKSTRECDIVLRLQKPIIIVFNEEAFGEQDVRKAHSEYPDLLRCLTVAVVSICHPDFHDRVANMVNAMKHTIEYSRAPTLGTLVPGGPPAPPSPPMIITVKTADDGTKVYFRPGTVMATRFTVTAVRIDVSFTRVIFAEGTDSPIRVIGLMLGARYAFSVFGMNEAGDGHPSAIWEYTLPRTLPAFSSDATAGVKRVISGYRRIPDCYPSPNPSARQLCSVHIIWHDDARPFAEKLKAVLREYGVEFCEEVHGQGGGGTTSAAGGCTPSSSPGGGTPCGSYEAMPLTVAIISPRLLESSRVANRIAAAAATALNLNQEKKFLPCYYSLTAAQLYDFFDPPRDQDMKEMIPMSKPMGMTHRQFAELLPRRAKLPPGPWEDIFAPLRVRPGYSKLPVERMFLAVVNKFTGLHYWSNEVPAKPRYPSELSYAADICGLIANFTGVGHLARKMSRTICPPAARSPAAPPVLPRPSVAPRSVADGGNTQTTATSTASTVVMTGGTTTMSDFVFTTKTPHQRRADGGQTAPITIAAVAPTTMTIAAAAEPTTGSKSDTVMRQSDASIAKLESAAATNPSWFAVALGAAKTLLPVVFATTPSTPMQVGGDKLQTDARGQESSPASDRPTPAAAAATEPRRANEGPSATMSNDVSKDRTLQTVVCSRSTSAPTVITVTVDQKNFKLPDNATIGDLRVLLGATGHTGDLILNDIPVNLVDDRKQLASVVADDGKPTVFILAKDASQLLYDSRGIRRGELLVPGPSLTTATTISSASTGSTASTQLTSTNRTGVIDELSGACHRSTPADFVNLATYARPFPAFPKTVREMQPPGPITKEQIDSAVPVRNVAYVSHFHAWTLAESVRDAIVALPEPWKSEPIKFSCDNFVITPQDEQTCISAIKGSRICLLLAQPHTHPRVLREGLLAVACNVPVVVLYDGDLHRAQDFEALEFENPDFFRFSARPLYTRFRSSTVSVITDAILSALREGAGIPWVLRKVIDPKDKMMVTIMGVLNRRSALDLHSGLMDELTSACVPDKYDLEPMPLKVRNLREGTDDQVADAARYFRDALGHENAEHRAAVRDAMLSCGAVSPLIRALGKTAAIRAVQYNLACALTNFCSGDAKHVQAVYEARGLELLVELLQQPAGPKGEPDVREMVPWNLTNIAGESIDHRDEIVRLNVLVRASRIVLQPTRPSDDVCREVAGLFYALHRPKPLPPWSESKKCLRAIIVLLEGTTDVDTAQRCLWTLAEFGLQPPPDAWTMLLDHSVLRVVARMLMVRDERVTIPAARVCGRLACGSAERVGKLLDPQYHMLRHLRVMMGGSEKERMESIWAVSNVLAEAPGDHVQCVVNEGITPILVAALSSPVEKIREESVCCVANLTRHGTDAHARIVSDQTDVVAALCRMFEIIPKAAKTPLAENHETMVSDALDVLIALLRVAELDRDQKTNERNRCAFQMEALGAHHRLANLAKRSTPLGDRAGRVVAYYFKASV